MRMRLLLIFLLAIAAMGADCGGGSSSNAGTPASSSAVTFAEIEDQGDDSAPPVPEPSALLVFGAGLLVAGAATRRSR